LRPDRRFAAMVETASGGVNDPAVRSGPVRNPLWWLGSRRRSPPRPRRARAAPAPRSRRAPRPRRAPGPAPRGPPAHPGGLSQRNRRCL